VIRAIFDDHVIRLSSHLNMCEGTSHDVCHRGIGVDADQNKLYPTNHIIKGDRNITNICFAQGESFAFEIQCWFFLVDSNIVQILDIFNANCLHGIDLIPCRQFVLVCLKYMVQVVQSQTSHSAEAPNMGL